MLQTPLGWLIGGVVALLLVASATAGSSITEPPAPRGRRRSRTSTRGSARGGSWRRSSRISLADRLGRLRPALQPGVTPRAARIRDPRADAAGRPPDAFWSFFVITPIQYWLVGYGWYGLFSILIPVYAFIILSVRTALAGDTEKFLERSASVQWGLMVCVYFVSHVPALLIAVVPRYARCRGRN